LFAFDYVEMTLRWNVGLRSLCTTYLLFVFSRRCTWVRRARRVSSTFCLQTTSKTRSPDPAPVAIVTHRRRRYLLTAPLSRRDHVLTSHATSITRTSWRPAWYAPPFSCTPKPGASCNHLMANVLASACHVDYILMRLQQVRAKIDALR